jgi:NADH-quinone oxidoreductase subunit H
LLQAEFNKRGKGSAVEFIAQHPILVVSLVKIVVLLFVLLTALAYLTWFERKVVAHIQSRWGPYYVGAHGLLQPLADGLKFLFKEDVTPPASDRLIYVLAPLLALSLALTTLALIPFGPATIHILGQPTHLAIADNVDIGLLALFAITSMGVYGVALAGWSSNSKYPLLGGLRSSAQMISYEVSLTLSVVGVLLVAGSLKFSEIIQGQSGRFFLHWNVIRWGHGGCPQIVGFLCYLIAAIAETNRVPFDLPEAETELVAGFHTEYSSFKFAMFFMAEYANMITVSCLATILFFGGWLSPFPDSFAWQQYLPGAGLWALALYLGYDTLRHMHGIARIQLAIVTVLCLGAGTLCLLPAVAPVVQGPFWFLGKVLFFLFVYVWVRGTLPRFRYDQLMSFGWKLLLPVSLANLVVTSFVIIYPLLRTHG